MHRYGVLAADLGWVALSPFLAFLIRDNFVLYPTHLEAVTWYAAIAVVTSAIAFLTVGAHKPLWQFTSLPEVLRILAAVTVALLLALFITFAVSRLDGVARSVPLIQWFLLVGAMVGTRVAVRIWHERTKRAPLPSAETSVQRVLVIGSGPVTELYFRSVAEYGAKTVAIVGILSEGHRSRGRRLRHQDILGTPEELSQVMSRLEVHGVIVDRIAVMQPFQELSHRAAQAILAVEQGSDVKVEWMVERLGLTHEEDRSSEPSTRELGRARIVPGASEAKFLSLGKYGHLKRVLDVLAVLLLSVLLAPVILLVGLLVCVDVGFPLVFWQQRPGRLGHPFKLYKFCTMGPAHDAQGNRIPDEQRLSKIGRLLRRTKLDELPQLYNILIGEMSVVGPRPLLPTDQPEDKTLRLSVRPGLTGFAQVHGGRDISAKDKNALDVWYVSNASLWLDFVVIMRTLAVLVRGEQVNHHALRVAREGLTRQTRKDNAAPGSRSLTSERFVGEGQTLVAPTNN